MAKFGFNDDELSKLFADAGAAVKKVKSAPQEEVGAPAEATTPPSGEEKQADHPAPGSRAEAVPPPRAESIPSAGGLKTAQVIGGAIEDANLQAMVKDRSMVTIPYKAIKCLALGRVEDGQMIGWIYGNTAFYISDKNVTYKGFIQEVAMSATQNWRQLLNELSQKIGLTTDTGIQALTSGGGLIPKYGTQEDFFRALQKLVP